MLNFHTFDHKRWLFSGRMPFSHRVWPRQLLLHHLIANSLSSIHISSDNSATGRVSAALSAPTYLLNWKCCLLTGPYLHPSYTVRFSKAKEVLYYLRGFYCLKCNRYSSNVCWINLTNQWVMKELPILKGWRGGIQELLKSPQLPDPDSK